MKMKPVHIDGALYVGIAICASLLASMSSDTATKLFADYPMWHFVILTFVEAAGAACGALKMFRSTGYSNSLTNPTDAPTETIPAPVIPPVPIVPAPAKNPTIMPPMPNG